MSKEKTLKALSGIHEGTEYKYTCCAQNGCWDASCIIKCEGKDGKLISISPDDSVNPNSPREDVGEGGFRQGMVQTRPCAMGHAWKGELNASTRVFVSAQTRGWERSGKRIVRTHIVGRGA